MKCPRGWILCQNNEGFTVPYFVKVRSTDVCVSSSFSDKFGLAGVIPSGMDSDNINILPPGQSYMLGINGWRIWLNNNETFKMSYSIDINATNAELVENEMVRVHVTLPFKIMTNDIVDIHTMHVFTDKRLSKSFENITYGEVSIDYDMKDFYVELYLTDVVADNFLSDTSVNQSRIVVIVEGAAQLGKYSHMDEKGQIGGAWDASSSGGNVNPNTVYTKDEVNALIQKIRNDVETGALIGPQDIVDVVDNVTDSVVLPKGIVFDVETPEEVAADEANKKRLQQQAQEQSDIQKLLDGENVVSIDISDLKL